MKRFLQTHRGDTKQVRLRLTGASLTCQPGLSAWPTPSSISCTTRVFGYHLTLQGRLSIVGTAWVNLGCTWKGFLCPPKQYILKKYIYIYILGP